MGTCQLCDLVLLTSPLWAGLQISNNAPYLMESSVQSDDFCTVLGPGQACRGCWGYCWGKGVFEKGHRMMSGWRLATLVCFWPISHIPSSTGLALSRPAPGFLFNPCPSQDSICYHTLVSVPSPIAVFLITSDLPNARSIPQTEQSCQSSRLLPVLCPRKHFK